MTEQRDWYLSMLGVHQYRQRLPGEAVFAAAVSHSAASASSTRRTAPSQGDIGASPASGQASQGEVIRSLASLRETLQGETAAIKPVSALVEDVHGVLASQAAKEPQKVAPASIPHNGASKIDEPDKGSLEEQGETRVSLACWQVSDEVLVINGFGYGERASRVQLELLTNILRAIGQLPNGLPAAELIEWPLKPGGDSTLAGAKTQLSMFLLGRQQVRPYRWLLALGEDAAGLLDEACVSEAAGVETIFTLSLQAMLAEPLRKREVWQALRHLRGAD
ncbi:hypothetical protein A9Q89_03785 [Gammaproteobacteria bacterium 53_120_T64]|nr:hypothetical protein A9Q89_03785 [Gammaproteobacteria bacterium 53_120_T64]